MTDPRAGQPGSGYAAAQPSVPTQYEPRQDGSRQPGDEDQYERQYGEMRPVRGDPLLAIAARQAWPAVLIGGLAMIALGIMLLVWPHASLTVVAILIGAALVVSGLVRLWEGFTASHASGGMRAAYVVLGLLAVLAGLYCLRHHALSLFIVAFLIGVYFIAHGLSDIGVALSVPVPGRGFRAVLGVCSLAAGIILIVWPAITIVLLLSIAGAWLIFYGLMLGGLAFSLWRFSRAARQSSGSGRLEAQSA